MAEHSWENSQNCIPPWTKLGMGAGEWWLHQGPMRLSQLLSCLTWKSHASLTCCHPNETLMWPKILPSEFQTTAQMLVVFRNFAKYAHEKYCFLEWGIQMFSVIVKFIIGVTGVKFCHNERGKQMREKTRLEYTPGQAPQSTLRFLQYGRTLPPMWGGGWTLPKLENWF